MANLLSRVFLVVIVEAAGKDGFEFNGRQKANRVAITIKPRAVVGNPNDRFDPGDAYLLQKFFRGGATPCAWDMPLDDLTGNVLVDSGEVIRVLCAVTGIVAQIQAETSI